MILYPLAKKLSEDPRLDAICHGRNTQAGGLAGGARSAFYSALYIKCKRPMLVISQDAQSAAEEIKAYLGDTKAHYFPSWDTFPTEEISPSSEIVGQRLGILDRLSNGDNIIVTASVKSAITWTLPPHELKKYSLTIKTGASIERDDILMKLVRIGYKRRDIVGERGEFGVRGGIIDIFPANNIDPVRIELLGNRIESIREFDSVTQRSISGHESQKVLPIHELILKDGEYSDGSEIKIPKLYDEFSSILDHFPENSLIILDEKQNLEISSNRFIKEVEELRGGNTGKYYLDLDDLLIKIDKFNSVEIGQAYEKINFGFNKAETFSGKIELLSEHINSKLNENAVLIVTQQADRISELLLGSGIEQKSIEHVLGRSKGAFVAHGSFIEGFSGNGILMLTDKELFGKLPSRIKFAPKPQEGISKDMLAEFETGDLVVHSNYGIGIYKGLVDLTIENALQEYIQIDFADEDKLYVPLHLMGLVEKYTGAGEHTPKLNRLGSAEWAKTRSKAKRSIKDMAEELTKLYSYRQKQSGHNYPPDPVWLEELERSFPYEETPDQEKAINDIKTEMHNGKLIDRLICGDVGYGKTEVALRVAYKTILSGKQVAMLTPTTVLADQHYRNFSERLKPYPVRLDMLSRFKSKDEQKSIIKELEAGSIDMVIGTHRLIQKDIKFKDLGLLIIDEEQKFGVEQKEKVKMLTKGVNVITLTATPIPRTLYMSLSGLREMSIIATPPLDRSPVRTYLRPWDENTIKEVILRELERGGQVYFVHNVVKTIDKVAALIRSLIPAANVAVAHGQMKEDVLEDAMIKFINKEYDILVSTSIIESGLDIPAVNTVIIDNAENFGLSQLYQIRGRVGRSSTRAFAYLLYHKDKVLTEQALERLKAIQEFTTLGSGYKLAMADLEIRGAGNILGAQQSGHILNIGFDMYCDLLEESVLEIKNIEIPTAKRVLIDLKIDAYIPKDYVPDEKQRIALYRRMNTLNNLTELGELKKEMVDRFGKIPNEFITLFRIIELKIEAGEKGVTAITGGSETVLIDLGPNKTIKIKTKGMSKEQWFEHVKSAVKRLPSK